MKILLVEDVRAVAALMGARLASFGHNVSLAENGQVGFEKFRELQPDLVFMDIEMPVMNGFTVCERLKQDVALKHIPVVILTGTNDPKLNEKAFKAGAEITALKALSAERLVNMLRLALAKSRATPPV